MASLTCCAAFASSSGGSNAYGILAVTLAHGLHVWNFLYNGRGSNLQKVGHLTGLCSGQSRGWRGRGVKHARLSKLEVVVARASDVGLLSGERANRASLTTFRFDYILDLIYGEGKS